MKIKIIILIIMEIKEIIKVKFQEKEEEVSNHNSLLCLGIDNLKP